MTGGWSLVRRLGGLAALVVVVVALVWCGWFRVEGGRWERVESPSMGTTAPVGTLLWVRPVDPAALEVGDVVSFHVPGSDGQGPVYSHRVTVVHGDGSLGTAGDLSGPDQWRVAPADVVGRVVHVWPGVGWLVLAAPVLLLGGAVTGVLARPGRRLPVCLLGASLTLTVAIVCYHPLSGAESLGSDRAAGGVRATYVSTGLLPVRLSAAVGGESVVLHAGQSGSVVARPSASGHYRVGLDPALPWWLWPALVAASLAPAVGASLRRLVGRPRLVRVRRPAPRRRHAHRAATA